MTAHSDAVLRSDLLTAVYAHYLVSFFIHTAPGHEPDYICAVFCEQHLDIHVEQKFIKRCDLIVIIVIMDKRHPDIALIIFGYKLGFRKLSAVLNIGIINRDIMLLSFTQIHVEVDVIYHVVSDRLYEHRLIHQLSYIAVVNDLAPSR